MLSNYLTTALRNLLKHKGYSVINILGPIRRCRLLPPPAPRRSMGDVLRHLPSRCRPALQGRPLHAHARWHTRVWIQDLRPAWSGPRRRLPGSGIGHTLLVDLERHTPRGKGTLATYDANGPRRLRSFFIRYRGRGSGNRFRRTVRRVRDRVPGQTVLCRRQSHREDDHDSGWAPSGQLRGSGHSQRPAHQLPSSIRRAYGERSELSR